MSETKTAVGTLAAITEKPSGWTTVEVALPGKEHHLKLDTKLANLIEEARAAGTETKEWKFSEHDSGNPNPHRPGSNFLNRRLEGVAAVGTSPQAQNANPDVDWDEKDRRDFAGRCWMYAITMAQHTFSGSETVEEQYVRVQALQRRIYGDITGAWGDRAASYLPEVLQPPHPAPDMDF